VGRILESNNIAKQTLLDRTEFVGVNGTTHFGNKIVSCLSGLLIEGLFPLRGEPQIRATSEYANGTVGASRDHVAIAKLTHVPV